MAKQGLALSILEVADSRLHLCETLGQRGPCDFPAERGVRALGRAGGLCRESLLVLVENLDPGAEFTLLSVALHQIVKFIMNSEGIGQTGEELSRGNQTGNAEGKSRGAGLLGGDERCIVRVPESPQKPGEIVAVHGVRRAG